MRTFPFGAPVTRVAQGDQTPKRVFVLGVYASAVHARWLAPDGRVRVQALAVASEPTIFWRGENASEIVESIDIPESAGSLVAAGSAWNGPSGRALDSMFLHPLRLDRSDCWLCDLLPESRCNPGQAKALEREYRPRAEALRLHPYDWPVVPAGFSTPHRRDEIVEEILKSEAEVLVTLGDQPLRWFGQHFGTKARLASYSSPASAYGQLHELCIGGRELKLLPLVHPRQAAGLSAHSPYWAATHREWMSERAASVFN
jgi:uracil-DNA glycosylase